jgi:hypothetical protein
MGTIDDILNDEPSEEPVAETPAEIVEEAPQIEEVSAETDDKGPVRDEKGRFAPKGETESASPAPAKQEYDPAPVIAERRRRQEAEQRAQALEQQLAALQNPAAPPPSIFEDEQGAFQHYGGAIVSEAVQQASLNATLNMSEMLARQANPDFDEMKSEFLALAEQNPSLLAEARADPHPWDKAYKIAKNARTMKELGATDLASLEAKLREKIMAEMQAQPAPVQGIPATISNERNVGQRTGPVWSGPRSLSELLS